MSHLFCYQLVYLVIWMLTYLLTAQTQDNIFTITPSQSLCIGETVVITCYLFPPVGVTYVFFARLSFNQSTSLEFTTINSNFGSIGYTATVGIPIIGDSARIQLTIDSFQVSDSNTLFGCHARFNSNGSDTEALESGGASLAGPVIFSTTTPEITFQIYQDLSISSSVNLSFASVERIDTLEYNFTLYYNFSSETLITSNKSVNFLTKFIVGTCYQISVSLTNCAGGEGDSFTKFFVFPGSGAGKFVKVPFNSSHIRWNYTIINCPEGPEGDYEENYIPSSFFKFSLRNLDTNAVYNITEFSLFLPQGFDLYIPNEFYNTAGRFVLRIEFLDTITDILFTIEETRSNAVLIILIVLFILLVILFCIILAVIILFVIIHFKRKHDSEK